MAYIPGCRYDLFISYANENNREGWVEQFEKVLREELGDLLGRQFSSTTSVFFDRREVELPGSFPEKLVAAARESAILVPVLSRSYLTSAWCDNERTAFFSKLPHGSKDADCLAPILIRPIDESGLNQLYRDAQRMSFLSADGQTPLEPSSPAWLTKVRAFAGQLAKALQKLRRNCKPVFLGKTAQTSQAQALRSWCRTEVECRHFRTLPESLLALDDPASIQGNLQEAGVAIHFLGNADAAAMEAIETSVAVCSGTTILYQPWGAHLDANEQLWLDSFERQLESTGGQYQRLAGKNDWELLALFDEIATQIRPEPHASGAAHVELALVCEEPDLGSIQQLNRDIQTQRPTGIALPEFVGSGLRALALMRKWSDYISRAEGLLFYYGASERKRLELIWQKATEEKPTVRRDWFLAPPALEHKKLQHPDALWELDQVIQFIERARGTTP